VRDDLSPSTVRGYERIRCYIVPAVGKLHVNKLRTDQLDRFYAHLRESGGADGSPLSPATIRQTHAVIRRALSQAHRWGWIASNSAALASPPRVRTRPVSPPDPSQVLDLIDEAQKLDPDMACFLLLAATTGARRGELCALRWTDIDLDLGTALIARSLVEGRGSELVEKDTKTHVPRRVALDKASIDELARHHEQCRHRAAACGSALRKSAHVFSLDPVGLRPWVPNEVTKRFIRIRKSVGLESARSSSS
jgi:integrase